jgi:hypothetical protein
MLEVTIIAKIQTLSIENIFYDGDIVRWRMAMRHARNRNMYANTSIYTLGCTTSADSEFILTLVVCCTAPAV